MNLFGLLDCNNFFVSCERVFNPHLEKHPVIVLSNNDGCIVSRSNEAKALGIPMGSPLFKVQDIVDRANVRCFSANFSLYGNMSKRVMSIIREHFENIEIYSVDEAFILFKNLDLASAEKKCREVRKIIKRNTGIPVCIGIAKTKTLAKLANHQAKKNPIFDGVFSFNCSDSVNAVLKHTQVEDIWGIGRQRTKFLKSCGIYTGYDLINQDKKWILKELTILGLRLVNELQGNACLKLEESLEPRKSILSSRSFGEPIYALSDLQEAITSHVLSTTATLRKEGSMASRIVIFIRTSAYTKKTYYSNSRGVMLPYPSDYSPDFLKAAHAALRTIYQPGIAYAKAGVLLQNITARTNTTRPLNMSAEEDDRRMKLMKTFDWIREKFGRDSLILGYHENTRKWKGKKNRLSRAYTTQWKDIPIAKT